MSALFRPLLTLPWKVPLDSTPLWYQLRPEEFQRRLHDIVCGMEGESLTDAQFWIL